MQKRITPHQMREEASSEPQWLNLERLADVEVTSEDQAHPIESALLPGHGDGWRAATVGDQTIRLLFNSPQQLRKIRLDFMETDIQRTQEYVLRWSSDHGRSFREIVRQQWNFSPPDSTKEREDHCVDLQGVTILELKIRPEMSGRPVCASVAQMRLA
ncbi:MAG TPA: hypothetical protein VL261_05410 [Nitrospira sp.]|jgi:hypothetical protein|nr:hypothetical protein [Nitrospira sp.]